MRNTGLIMACCMLPCCFVACSKHSSTAHDASSDVSQRLNISSQRPVLFTGQGIAAFERYAMLDDSLIGQFRSYLNHKGADQKNTLDQLRQQLKLKPDQILLIGFNGSQHKSIALDLSTDRLLEQANVLSINHIRAMRTPQPTARGEFEKQDAYQQRLQKQQIALNNLTQHMQVDLGRFEDALNFLAQPIVIDQYQRDQLNQYHYDVEQERLTIRVPLRPITEQEWNNQRGRTAQHPLTLMQLSAACPPDLAQQIKQNISENAQYVLGFILDVQQGQYKISRLILFQSSSYRPLAQMPAAQIEMLNLQADQTVQSRPLPLNQYQNLAVGMQYYQAPEVINPPSDHQLKSKPPSEQVRSSLSGLAQEYS